MALSVRTRGYTRPKLLLNVPIRPTDSYNDDVIAPSAVDA